MSLSRTSRASPRRLLTGLGVGVCLLLLLAALQPYPRWQEGATFCLPLLGPRLNFPRGLNDSARTRIEAHEAVHADQCRILGSWDLFASHWRPAIRLRLEAEAACAEAHVVWGGGRRPDHVFEELVDDLMYGVPRGSAPEVAAARAAATSACPDLARAAREYVAARQVSGAT